MDRQFSDVPAVALEFCGTHGSSMYSSLCMAGCPCPPSDEQVRFWQKVAIRDIDNCWIWMASKKGIKGKQYGQLRVKRGGRPINQGAHILSFEYARGPVESGLFVCHECDEKLCVNPTHLFLGTVTDNNRDMMKKKRHKFGVRHWNAKLTPEDLETIRDLRAQGKSQYEIARVVDVNQSEISRVLSAKRRRLA